jgi:hypothetical protein
MIKIFKQARAWLRTYDSMEKAGSHYNPAAKAAYGLLATGHMPRTYDAWIALDEGLTKFDMSRQLGSFASKQRKRNMSSLRRILVRLAPYLRPLLLEDISVAAVRRRRAAIILIFDRLSQCPGVMPTERFPVGASKVLHFLNPGFFPIIDKRVAWSLHRINNQLPKTASRYTGIHYLNAMEILARDINAYGRARLHALQPSEPALRVVDKILFSQYMLAEEFLH